MGNYSIYDVVILSGRLSYVTIFCNNIFNNDDSYTKQSMFGSRRETTRQ